MSRPRRKALPAGVYERNGVYYISYQVNGRQRQERAGRDLRAAIALRQRRIEEVEAGTYDRKGMGEQTLAAYVSTWRQVRESQGKRSAAREEQLLADHVLPYLGSKRLSDLRPRDVEAWIHSLEGKLAPKSILNAHGVLSAVLGRAVFDELVTTNVARALPAGTLPQNVRAREVAAWTADECHILMTHEGIPEDRRVAHAFVSYTGSRCGEAAGARFCDIDRKASPMWRWQLRTQYDGKPLKGKGRQGGPPRDIPIHPELQRMLEEWERIGWHRLVGRLPRPEDFIIPREDGLMHSKQSLGAKSVKRAAKVAGIDATGRDFHSFRRAMITIARSNGARAEIVERITHNAAGAQIDGYTYFGWDVLCEAISQVKIGPAKLAEVVPLQAVAGTPRHDQSMTRGPETGKKAYVLNGGAGSRTRVRERSAVTSTCVARVLFRDPTRPSGWLFVPLSTLYFRPSPGWWE